MNDCVDAADADAGDDDDDDDDDDLGHSQVGGQGGQSHPQSTLRKKI